MDKAVKRAYLQIHLAVLLFGLTAILGDLIKVSALSIVWWRVLLTSASFLFLVNLKYLKAIPRATILRLFGIGALIALHWLTFYGSIKYANASVALVCLATTSFLTSIFEPLILKQRFKSYEILIGLIIIPGMWLIVSDLKTNMMTGVYVGLSSALLATIFSILNKKYVDQIETKSMALVEMFSAFLTMSILLPFYLYYSTDVKFWMDGMDWIYMGVLVLGCTTLAFLLNLKSLKHLSAFTSNLIINLEPVYGILLAMVILNEHRELNTNFYIGVVVILTSVFLHPILKKKFDK
jgi:drug/metabolite transporter (DMT)-like permease